MGNPSVEIEGPELTRVRSVLQHFLPESQDPIRVSRLGDGNINDTYLVKPEALEPIVLQRINPKVFPEPWKVAENVHTVTSHILRKQADQGEILPFTRTVPTLEGSCYYADEEGAIWRSLSYVSNTRTYRSPPSEREAYEGGKMLGRFHHLLDDLDGRGLHQPLPGFHDLPGYAGRYKQAVTNHKRINSSRLNACCRALDSRLPDADLLEEQRSAGILPERVIHGDPKCDNILFSNQSGAAVGIIDLDTVSSGLLLYDLGDCLRSFCNRAGEHPADIAQVCFDTEFCFQILNGYRDSGSRLQPAEQVLIYQGVRLLTFELALRFLTDYLEGDQYFKTGSTRDNLDRAFVQIKLLESIEHQREPIEAMAGRLR